MTTCIITSIELFCVASDSSSSTFLTIPGPCFVPVCFTPFYSNAPSQFTPLLNLCPLILGLMPYGWFICIYFFGFSHKTIIFELGKLIQEHNYGIRQGVGVFQLVVTCVPHFSLRSTTIILCCYSRSLKKGKGKSVPLQARGAQRVPGS